MIDKNWKHLSIDCRLEIFFDVLLFHARRLLILTPCLDICVAPVGCGQLIMQWLHLSIKVAMKKYIFYLLNSVLYICRLIKQIEVLIPHASVCLRRSIISFYILLSLISLEICSPFRVRVIFIFFFILI